MLTFFFFLRAGFLASTHKHTHTPCDTLITGKKQRKQINMCVHAFGFCLHRAAQIEEVNDVAFRVTEEREERKKKKRILFSCGISAARCSFFSPFFSPSLCVLHIKICTHFDCGNWVFVTPPRLPSPSPSSFPLFFFFLFSTLCKTKIHGHQHVEPFRSKSRRFLSFLHL